MYTQKLALSALLLFISFQLFGQDITQTVRGTVTDADIKTPLIGATVVIQSEGTYLGAITDLDGYFKLENVPVGRHDLAVTYLGYEPAIFTSLSVNSGKELVLEIELQESAEQLAEVVVSAADQVDKTKPLNEFALVSARTFSVEETSRYAFSAYDPARMAQNFAGVSIGSSDDLFNEIVIRGNSPSGVLWRLEGIPIPNPNHFGAMGNSGGAISMLSSSTLSNSDFYTGAFPAEFGNALSGVFDLKMRKGNNEQREYSAMIGALGLELAAEGPFRQGGASYLINYRYSTLAALQAIGLNPVGDILPTYQDLSFNLFFPTAKWGNFTVFGLGGDNLAGFRPEADSLLWDSPDDRWGFEENGTMGTIGATHSLVLSDHSYLRTVAVASYEGYTYNDYYLDTEANYRSMADLEENTGQTTYRISSTYQHKLNANHTFQTGIILSHQRFRFITDERVEGFEELQRRFDNSGGTELVQGFGNWKYRLNNKWTVQTGVHATLMTLNNQYAVEPRLALQWQATNRQTLSFAAGLHSRMEHLATYLFEGKLSDGTPIYPKTNLGLTKAAHLVLGYDFVFTPTLRLKTELYYQHLYNVPVENEPTSTRSILNATDIWDVLSIQDAVATGTGRNMGLDVTLERFFADQYYFMLTGAIYDSRYTPADGNTYSTRFNGNYQMNVLGGKEFTLGKKENKTLGLNAKFILSGGNRFTPVNLDASREAGYTVLYRDQPYEDRSKTYYRVDIGLSYRINAPKVTHTFQLDIQNVTNRANEYLQYYNPYSEQLESWTQTGLFPNFNYRVEF